MARPGRDVLSLRAYVQLPQHVSDELLHVLMATVVEGDARALSVGQWFGGHDPIRVDNEARTVTVPVATSRARIWRKLLYRED